MATKGQNNIIKKLKNIFTKNEDFTLTCVMHYRSYVDIWGGVGPNK